MKFKIPQMSKIGMLIIFLVILPAFFAGCASKNDVKQKKVDVDQLVKDVTKASAHPKLITEIGTSEDSESISVFIKSHFNGQNPVSKNTGTMFDTLWSLSL